MGTLTLNVQYVTESCCHEGCNISWAFTRAYYEQVRNDGRWWYCPAGHRQHYSGKSDEQKLREAEAQNVALKDQLDAAVRDAEIIRQALVRDRHRFFNGVCPCCSRSFQNVRRHMLGEHPDYDINAISAHVKKEAPFQCSCGDEFETYRGLRSHQGHLRRDGWERDAQKSDWWSQRSAHLTVV